MSPNADSQDHGEPARIVFDRLPELYRESPELLEPLVDAAEDLMANLFDRLERSGGAGREPPLGDRAQTLDVSTSESVSRFLEEELGAAPRVWNGLKAVPHPAGGVVFRKSDCRASVVAWEKSRLVVLPPGFRFPEEALPVGVRVDAVALGRLPRSGAPHVGERFSGEVLTTWGAGGKEEVSPWT